MVALFRCKSWHSSLLLCLGFACMLALLLVYYLVSIVFLPLGIHPLMYFTTWYIPCSCPLAYTLSMCLATWYAPVFATWHTTLFLDELYHVGILLLFCPLAHKSFTCFAPWHSPCCCHGSDMPLNLSLAGCSPLPISFLAAFGFTYLWHHNFGYFFLGILRSFSASRSFLWFVNLHM